jgi:hypothetical protein
MKCRRIRLIASGTLLLGNYMMLQRFGLMAVAALGLSTIALADGEDCEAAGNSPECCELVCKLDPFCCQVEWDDYCGSVAEASCIQDCDGDGIADSDEIARGAADCNGNGIPDGCEGLPTDDCNCNGVPDSEDINRGDAFDCNRNGLPDECEDLLDSDGNGVPDGCEGDCNGNGIPDVCDILDGRSEDYNYDGVPDECQQLEDEEDQVACVGDLSGDGQISGADLGLILGSWGATGNCLAADLDRNGIVNGADLGLVLGMWGSDC